jgi:predicted nucleic acid-binding protein
VEANHRRLNTVLEIVKTWPLDADLSSSYAELYLKAKSRGQLMESTGLFLATLAAVHGAVILTTDKDFSALPEVKTENWLV